MSKLVLIRDPQFQHHLTPELHPESPKRVAAIDQAFEQGALRDDVSQLTPRSATEADICLVHEESYVETLHDRSEKIEPGGSIQVDPDTYMSAESFDTAKLAVGAGLVAIDALQNDSFSNAFVSIRPPGHHALADKSMGFCLFNNIAIAARYAQKKLESKRVLIIDWDVHHGNGTQDIFYDDPSVCFISLHQYPFWPPNSGWYADDGAGAGKGFNVNIPLPSGTGDRGYLHAWDQIVKPISLQYQPDLILLSAGYDAHSMDPLGQQRISTSGYAMLAQRLMDLSWQTNTKVAAFLEGGYNLQSLADSALATMRVFNADGAEESADVHVSYLIPGSAEGSDPITQDEKPEQVNERVLKVRKHFSSYWQSLK